MALVKAKDIFTRLSSVLSNIYDDRESMAIAKNYLADRLHIDGIKLAMNSEIVIDESLLTHDLRQLTNGTPYQHVVGFTVFYGREFISSQHALIPRPETEELVDWIIKENQVETPKILDIGTGTGCIPISLKGEIQQASCSGIDISDEAIELSKKNAKKNELEVHFQKLDILSQALQPDHYDIIISNPPYIPNADRTMMHTNVLDHEPEIALFVPDENPLIFYEAIAEKGLNSLKTKGKLYFEIHERYGVEVCDLLKSLGYHEICLKQDLQGKDRMISASRK